MIKKILISIFSIIIIPSIVFAAQVKLTWDAPDSGTPTKYRIYQKNTSDPYTNVPVWEGTELTCTIEEPVGVEHAYVATAVYEGNISGEIYESGYSNEVKHMTLDGLEPKQLIIEGIKQLISGLNKILQGMES